MLSRRTSVLLTAGLVSMLVLGGSSAFAQWSASGGGSGSASTGTTASLTISGTAATDSLYPGSSTAVSFVVSNPDTAPVIVGSFTLDTSVGTGGFAVDAGHVGCALSTLSFTPPPNPSGWTIPAQVSGVDGSLSISLTNALTMSASAASACQGATFTVYLAVGP
ncbi:hypothetical protein [Cryobacterium sp. N22]|uniref:hypothetical protein n=1 Tax=Cryobacterium sp. N22 TaxID=2048290 RepID=UPI0011B05061|nr:hypothetical protein [Cryobacterium sp. N22]